ncbi:MAG: hypothetical protein LUM44_20460 [Pyrinomonadaceae bacterium]|nr:hypothetical protein [Pyrinomonadaceae bacterium]
MPRIIPQSKFKKVEFLTLFKTKFQSEGESLSFSSDEIETAVIACETIIYSIKLADFAKAFSKSCTTFKESKTKGLIKTETGGTIPTFSAPEPPAVIYKGNAVGYLQKIFKRIKAQPDYSEGVGLNLGIIPPKSAPLNLREAAPKGLKIQSLSNSVVRIDWRKGKFDGVIVKSQFLGEIQWFEIGRDIYSPFIDTRPPREAGKPEVRRYQLYYMLDDKAVGEPSAILETATKP